LDNHIVIAPGCSELQLSAGKPAGKSRFTTFWGAIIIQFTLKFCAYGLKSILILAMK
jgi:hypothetical protein